MTQPDRLFETAISRFDAANAEDPKSEEVDGATVPAALVYARRMTERLHALTPDASEALRLAARAQHLLRWTIPRETYPTGRQGYHAWRGALTGFHAAKAAEILRGCGYEEPAVERVKALLRKARLKQDADAQTLEDVACLVFLEHYLAGFSRKHEPAKVIGILRKTWRKMSTEGRKAARELSLPPEAMALVERAVAT